MITVIFRTNDGAKWGTGKGSNLSPAEVDDNFWNLKEAVEDLQANPTEPNEIASITVAGSALTVHMANGSTIGPLPMPVLAFRWRGNWTAGSSYSELDIFIENVGGADDGIYMVLIDHVAAGTFDPAAVDGSSNPLYQKVFGLQAPAFLSGMSDISFDAPRQGDIIRWTDGIWINVRQKYLLASNYNGAMADNLDLLHHILPIDVTFPENFGNFLDYTSKAGATDNASADTVITIAYATPGSPNSFTDIGTITISAGTVTAALASTSGAAHACLKGGVIRIRGPAIADSTLAGFYCTLVGFET